MALLDGTPYSLPEAGSAALMASVADLAERVDLLRRDRRLTADTLRAYYGEKRFEAVAESNAIEGSPLTAGETKLAVQKGITISGHDPAYSRDARSLHSATLELETLAQTQEPTGILQLHKVHALIFGERPGGGSFRNAEVKISGAKHVPPRDIRSILDAMERWENWSLSNAAAPPLVRAAVLHAWLTHIHPYIDGNGRLSRAIQNLELIRGGYPPVIIRRKDRERYLDALAESDDGGNIGPFFDLVFHRAAEALHELERTAKATEGYDPVAERVRRRYETQLHLWDTGVDFLGSLIEAQLGVAAKEVGEWQLGRYEERTDLGDFIELLRGLPPSGRRTWRFDLSLALPGLGHGRYLGWVGYRSDGLRQACKDVQGAGPSLYWSRRNPARFPPWISLRGEEALGIEELTLRLPEADRWYAMFSDRSAKLVTPHEVARILVGAVVDRLSP